MKLKIHNQLSNRLLRSRLRSRKTNPIRTLYSRKSKSTKTKFKPPRVRATSLRYCRMHHHPKFLLSSLNSRMPAKRKRAKTNQKYKSQASKRFTHLLMKAIRTFLTQRIQAIILTLTATESMILVKAAPNKGLIEANPKVTKACSRLNVLSHN